MYINYVHYKKLYFIFAMRMRIKSLNSWRPRRIFTENLCLRYSNNRLCNSATVSAGASGAKF
jgi:hypothetical protein